MSKLSSTFKFPSLKLVTLAATFSLLSLGAIENASAGIISASASSRNAVVNLTITPLVGPAVSANATLNLVTAFSNQSNMNTVVSAAIAPFLTTGVLNGMASTSFVPGGAGNAMASASTANVALILGLIGTSVTADAISSSATLIKNNAGNVTAIGTTSIVNGQITSPFLTTGLAANPAPNTVLFNAGGIQLVLNEQVFNGSTSGVACTAPCTDTFVVTALRLSFNNAVVSGSTVNGFVLISRSQVALQKNVQANGGGGGTVPEPATLLLFGLGLLGMVSLSRRAKNG